MMTTARRDLESLGLAHLQIEFTHQASRFETTDGEAPLLQTSRQTMRIIALFRVDE